MRGGAGKRLLLQRLQPRREPYCHFALSFPAHRDALYKREWSEYFKISLWPPRTQVSCVLAAAARAIEEAHWALAAEVERMAMGGTVIQTPFIIIFH